MTAINYSDLCAYVARRAADVAQFAVDILGSWSIPADAATAEISRKLVWKLRTS